MDINIDLILLVSCVLLLGVGGTLMFSGRRKQKVHLPQPGTVPDLPAPPDVPQERMSGTSTDLNIVAIKLRTQVTSTRWFAEMLLYKEYGKLNFAQMEMIAQIKDSCHKASELLNELLDNINTKKPGAIQTP